jgi:AcrR family transcriptional regulator
MTVGNTVPVEREHRSRSLAEERASRRVEQQEQAFTEELDALVQAAFTVVARSGSLDPSVRDILQEAGLSNQAFYRHVDSKDELLLLMLDAGRRSLVAYLDHQMEPCTSGPERVAVWVGGVLAQAADEEVARRTRPFVAQVDRLAELFPDEQRRSEDLLVDQISAAAAVSVDVGTVIYDMAFGALGRHLRRNTFPDNHDAKVIIAFTQQTALVQHISSREART